jgi:beta-lactamase class A
MKDVSYRLFYSIVLFMGISTHAFGDAASNSAQTQFKNLEASSGGRLGIAAIDMHTNQRILYRADEPFPMGCTSKVIGVAAVLEKSTENNALLQERIFYKKNDLTNWTPITEKHLKDGMTVAELCAAAISYSDNTAMNLLARKLGGPKELNAFARSIQDKNFKLDHWWPDEALSSPKSREDESTPAAMEASLRQLVLGRVLAPSQRDMLITWLKQNVTGDNRIRAGVPKGWIVGDKTGSGFNYGTTNDIAVIWAPQCDPIVVTIFYSSNKKDAPKREDILALATRILINTYAHTNECIRRNLNNVTS